MRLTELLGLCPGAAAVIGGGGKTTLLRTLGEELAAGGARVLLCSTTKIFPFDGLPNLTDPTEETLAEALGARRLVCAGTPVPGTGGKLTAPAVPMSRLAELADYVLVEADGSAGRPFKAHAPHEPVIPPEANQILWVVGASGFGRPVREAVHRPERFGLLTGLEPEAPAAPEAVAEALANIRQGGGRPHAVILDTVKGAGIKEVEDTAMNHSLTVSDEQFERWTAQLKAQLAELEG